MGFIKELGSFVGKLAGVISDDAYLRNKGTRQFVDAAGDTSANTGAGWIQYNPNYKSI
jgi:hypothetical protein